MQLLQLEFQIHLPSCGLQTLSLTFVPRIMHVHGELGGNLGIKAKFPYSSGVQFLNQCKLFLKTISKLLAGTPAIVCALSMDLQQVNHNHKCV